MSKYFAQITVLADEEGAAEPQFVGNINLDIDDATVFTKELLKALAKVIDEYQNKA